MNHDEAIARANEIASDIEGEIKLAIRPVQVDAGKGWETIEDPEPALTATLQWKVTAIPRSLGFDLRDAAGQLIGLTDKGYEPLVVITVRGGSFRQVSGIHTMLASKRLRYSAETISLVFL